MMLMAQQHALGDLREDPIPTVAIQTTNFDRLGGGVDMVILHTPLGAAAHFAHPAPEGVGGIALAIHISEGAPAGPKILLRPLVLPRPAEQLAVLRSSSGHGSSPVCRWGYEVRVPPTGLA